MRGVSIDIRQDVKMNGCGSTSCHPPSLQVISIFFTGANGAEVKLKGASTNVPLITDRGHRKNRMIAARLLSMIDYQQTAERNGEPVASRHLIGFWLCVQRATAPAAWLQAEWLNCALQIDVDQSATCVSRPINPFAARLSARTTAPSAATRSTWFLDRPLVGGLADRQMEAPP